MRSGGTVVSRCIVAVAVVFIAAAGMVGSRSHAVVTPGGRTGVTSSAAGAPAPDPTWLYEY